MNFTKLKLENIDNLINDKPLIVEGSFRGHQVEGIVQYRECSENIIVFMPSAQDRSQPPKIPVFHRWSWANEFPHSTIITLTDPSLYTTKGHASWFLAPEYNIDHIEILSEFLEAILSKTGLTGSRVYLYGSSMGGFGALMMSANVSNSHAIAEVPQLDLRSYPYKSVKKGLKDNILLMEVEDFYLNQPQKVSVLSRFLKFGKIPSFTLVTNTADDEYDRHHEFIKNLSEVSELVKSVGSWALIVWPEPIGHAPLPRIHGVEIIKNVLQQEHREVERTTSISLKENFATEVVNEIRERIPEFQSKYDYRNAVYEPDGSFAHTAQYSINGADPNSNNKVTQVNGGLKFWSLWHLGGRKDHNLLTVARQVGVALIESLTDDDIIPLDKYNSGYFQYEDGWISGIQLKIAALWARLWSVEQNIDKKRNYEKSIYRLLNRYLRPLSEGGILSNLEDVSTELSKRWIPQEYPIPNSSRQRHVLNGAQFAVLALYDTAHILGDEDLLAKADLYNTSLLHVGALATVADKDNVVTSYGLEYYTKLDTQPRLYNAPYHLTHIVLAGVLYQATQHAKWLDLANDWIYQLYGYFEVETKKSAVVSIENFKKIEVNFTVEKAGNTYYVEAIAPHHYDGHVEYALYFYNGAEVVEKVWYQQALKFSVDLNCTVTKIRFFARHVTSKHTLYKDMVF
jgi:hypothetical protein